MNTGGMAANPARVGTAGATERRSRDRDGAPECGPVGAPSAPSPAREGRS